MFGLLFCVISLQIYGYMGERVKRAPLKPGEVVPEPVDYMQSYQLKFAHPSIIEKEMDEYDKETLAKEKCSKTPFEWPRVDIRASLYEGRAGNITVYIRSWIRLKLNWQKRVNVYDNGILLNSYTVPITGFGRYHQEKTYVSGSNYESNINIANVSHPDFQPAHLSLLVYILHPCHEVVINIGNFNRFTGLDLRQAHRVIFPEVVHLPKSLNEVYRGSPLSLRAVLIDKTAINSNNPVVEKWRKVYERRGNRVNLVFGRKFARNFDRSGWIDENKEFEVNVELKFTEIIYQDSGLFEVKYRPSEESADLEVIIYSEIRVSEAYTSGGIYTCASTSRHMELQKDLIGIRKSEENCFYCITYSPISKPKVQFVIDGESKRKSLPVTNHVSLGKSYHLAQYALKRSDWLLSHGGNVTCRTVVGDSVNRVTTRLMVYEPIMMSRFRRIGRGRSSRDLFECVARGYPKPEMEFYVTSASNMETVVNTDDVIDPTRANWLRIVPSRGGVVIKPRSSWFHKQKAGIQSFTITISRSKKRYYQSRIRGSMAYACLAKNRFSQAYLIVRAP